MTDRFAADWLALREPFDLAARSVALARRLADRLPRRPRLMDLGAGTGSMFRFLAPIIGRGQDWTLVDADAALLDDAFGRTAAWARRHHFAATADGEELLVSTPQACGGCGRWCAISPPCQRRAAAMLMRLYVPRCSIWSRRHGFRGCAARWLCLSWPASPSMGVTSGDHAIHPTHWCWRPSGVTCDATRALAPRLAHPHPAHSPRRHRRPPTGAFRAPRSGMQRALIDGTADAARNARPAQAAAITAWQEARLRQALRGRLAITIGHRDILALPPGG